MIKPISKLITLAVTFSLIADAWVPMKVSSLRPKSPDRFSEEAITPPALPFGSQTYAPKEASAINRKAQQGKPASPVPVVVKESASQALVKTLSELAASTPRRHINPGIIRTRLFQSGIARDAAKVSPLPRASYQIPWLRNYQSWDLFLLAGAGDVVLTEVPAVTKTAIYAQDPDGHHGVSIWARRGKTVMIGHADLSSMNQSNSDDANQQYIWLLDKLSRREEELLDIRIALAVDERGAGFLDRDWLRNIQAHARQFGIQIMPVIVRRASPGGRADTLTTSDSTILALWKDANSDPFPTDVVVTKWGEATARSENGRNPTLAEIQEPDSARMPLQIGAPPGVPGLLPNLSHHIWPKNESGRHPVSNDPGPGKIPLTESEQQILDLAAAGLSVKAIAANLGIRPSLVSNRTRTIRLKRNIPGDEFPWGTSFLRELSRQGLLPKFSETKKEPPLQPRPAQAELARHVPLAGVDRKVAELAAAKLTSPQIAAKLGIGLRNVKNRIYRIRIMLKIPNDEFRGRALFVQELRRQGYGPDRGQISRATAAGGVGSTEIGAGFDSGFEDSRLERRAASFDTPKVLNRTQLTIDGGDNQTWSNSGRPGRKSPLEQPNWMLARGQELFDAGNYLDAKMVLEDAIAGFLGVLKNSSLWDSSSGVEMMRTAQQQVDLAQKLFKRASTFAKTGHADVTAGSPQRHLQTFFMTLLAAPSLGVRLHIMSIRWPALRPAERIDFMHRLLWLADWEEITQLMTSIFKSPNGRNRILRAQILETVLEEDETGKSLYVLEEVFAQMSTDDLQAIEEQLQSEDVEVYGAIRDELKEARLMALMREWDMDQSNTPLQKHVMRSANFKRWALVLKSGDVPKCLFGVADNISNIEAATANYLRLKAGQKSLAGQHGRREVDSLYEKSIRLLNDATKQLDDGEDNSIALYSLTKMKIYLEDSYANYLERLAVANYLKHKKQKENLDIDLSNTKTEMLQKLGLFPNDPGLNLSGIVSAVIAVLGLSLLGHYFQGLAATTVHGAFAASWLPFLAVPVISSPVRRAA